MEILKKEATYYPSIKDPFAFGSGAIGGGIAEIVRWMVAFKEDLAIQDLTLLDIREGSDITNAINLVYAAYTMGILDDTEIIKDPYKLAELFNSLISNEYNYTNDISDEVFKYSQYIYENREAIFNNNVNGLTGGEIKARIFYSMIR